MTHLASSVAPWKPAYVIESFLEATQKAFSYLLLDYRQKTPNLLRLRTNVLLHESPLTIFIEK